VTFLAWLLNRFCLLAALFVVQASSEQLSQFGLLFRTQAAARAVSKYALPAGIVAAVLAVGCAAAAFWQTGGGNAAASSRGEEQGMSSGAPGLEGYMESGDQEGDRRQRPQQAQHEMGSAEETRALLTDAYIGYIQQGQSQ
jgi:hypothetical protein